DFLVKDIKAEKYLSPLLNNCFIIEE
ncbi:hypothetical protein TNIN_347601, partial [Trichonephila inaurata madagascariensis]